MRPAQQRWAVETGHAFGLLGAQAALARRIGADLAAVAAAADQLAVELSYIEACRETLLEPVRSLGFRLDRLQLGTGAGRLRDELGFSRRLAGVALGRIGARFADVDARTADIAEAIRHRDGLRTYIRSHRDWLQRSRLAWAGLLAAWRAEPGLGTAARQALVGRTYRFLAPRFMSVQDWRASDRRRSGLRGVAVVEW